MTGPKKLRWRIADEIKKSSLPPDGRHVLWVLLSDADVDTGVVPAEHTPSLTGLAKHTGLARSTVAARIADLRLSGWLHVDSPPVADQRAKKARNRYRVCLPATSAGPGAGLVREPDQSEGRTSASPGHGPEQVRDTDRAGPADGLNPDADISDHHQTGAGAAGAPSDPGRGRAEVVDDVVRFLGQPDVWSTARVKSA